MHYLTTLYIIFILKKTSDVSRIRFSITKKMEIFWKNWQDLEH